MPKSKKTKNRSKKLMMLSIVVFVLGVVFIGMYLQANSIAVIVNEKGTHKAVDSAFSACDAKRIELRAQGKDCEPCRLTCPKDVTKQSDGLYTFSYLEGSAIYEGTFKDLECDTVGEEVGRLLEVKSFCNDNIRVCEEQDGNAVQVSTEGADNGILKKYLVKVNYVNCDTGVKTGSPIFLTKWQIYCDAGYVVNGNRVSDSKYSLGYCEPEDTDQKVIELSGDFTQLHIDDRAGTNEEITVKGTFKAKKDGKYYIYATVKPKSQAFSVVSKFGSQDLCGNDKHTAGSFFNLKESDIALFELSIPAPKDSGTYKVHVAARDGCIRDDMASHEGSVEVYNQKDLEDKVIEEVITENPDIFEETKEEIKDTYEEIEELESCTGDEDFTVEGCAIAECIDGEVFLLSEEQIQANCDDQEIAETINIARDEYIEETSSLFSRVAMVLGGLVVIGGSSLFIFRKK